MLLLVLVLTVVGVALRRSATGGPLGRCRMGSGGESGPPGSLLLDAPQFWTIASWSPNGGPADPPGDNTVTATASRGVGRTGAPAPAEVAAHVSTSDDVELALGRNYRVFATTKDVGRYDNYVIVAVGIAPDGQVEFLGECSEPSSRWFANVARDVAMDPESMLVDHIEHRESSVLSTKVLTAGG